MSDTILNFGSINIDYVYQVPHFVAPGETLASHELNSGLGGKGANQSVAIARAGGQIMHLGCIGEADRWAITRLEELGVDTSLVKSIQGPSGHAIIQVNQHGENAIILHGGANQSFSSSDIETAIARSKADYLLLQNETNALEQALDLAKHHGLKAVLNPAPMSDAIKALPLKQLDILIVNEIEAQALSGQTTLEDQLGSLREMAPNTTIVITLGGKGAVLLDGEERIEQAAERVDVVDTTGAGDTFVGFFLAGVSKGLNNAAAMQRACQAAAVTTTHAGAIDAIAQVNLD